MKTLREAIKAQGKRLFANEGEQMRLSLTDGEIEMVLTALRGTLDVWNGEAKKPEAPPMVVAMAEAQIKSWNALYEKVSTQYEG